MRLRLICTRIGVAVSCAPASIGTPGAATSNRPSRETVNSAASPARESPPNSVTARAAAEIGTTPLEAWRRTERALSPCPAQNLLQPARIAIAARAENCGIETPVASAATSSQRCMPSMSTTPHTVACVRSEGRWRLRPARCIALHRGARVPGRMTTAGRGGPGRMVWSLEQKSKLISVTQIEDSGTVAVTQAHIKKLVGNVH